MFEVTIKCKCGSEDCEFEWDEKGNLKAICNSCGAEGIIVYA